MDPVPEDEIMQDPDIIKSYEYYNTLQTNQQNRKKRKQQQPSNDIRMILTNYANERECDEEERRFTISFKFINWILADDKAIDTLPEEVKECNDTKESLKKQIDNAGILYRALHQFPKVPAGKIIRVYRGVRCTHLEHLIPNTTYSLPTFTSTSVFKETAKRFTKPDGKCIMVIDLGEDAPLPVLFDDLQPTKKNLNRKNISSEAEILLPYGIKLTYTGNNIENDITYYYFTYNGKDLKYDNPPFIDSLKKKVNQIPGLQGGSLRTTRKKRRPKYKRSYTR
jgi:hypothetical protein